MLNTKQQKETRAIRREIKKLSDLSYRCHETDWEIIRGGRTDERIVDAKISVCGRYIWTLLGKKKDNQ